MTRLTLNEEKELIKTDSRCDYLPFRERQKLLHDDIEINAVKIYDSLDEFLLSDTLRGYHEACHGDDDYPEDMKNSLFEQLTYAQKYQLAKQVINNGHAVNISSGKVIVWR